MNSGLSGIDYELRVVLFSFFSVLTSPPPEQRNESYVNCLFHILMKLWCVIEYTVFRFGGGGRWGILIPGLGVITRLTESCVGPGYRRNSSTSRERSKIAKTKQFQKSPFLFVSNSRYSRTRDTGERRSMRRDAKKAHTLRGQIDCSDICRQSYAVCRVSTAPQLCIIPIWCLRFLAFPSHWRTGRLFAVRHELVLGVCPRRCAQYGRYAASRW